MAIYCPSIFSLPQKKIQTIVHLLKEQCLFTMQQVSKILQTCPNILLENLEDLEYKFQASSIIFALSFLSGDMDKYNQFSYSVILNSSVRLNGICQCMVPILTSPVHDSFRSCPDQRDFRAFSSNPYFFQNLIMLLLTSLSGCPGIWITPSTSAFLGPSCGRRAPPSLVPVHLKPLMLILAHKTF